MVLAETCSGSASSYLPGPTTSAVTSRTIKGYAALGTDPDFRTGVILSRELSPGWQLRQPILVHIETDEDGRFLASDDITVVYGEGDTRRAALRAYVQSLIEYYTLTEDEVSQGSPDAREQLDRFQLYLAPAD